MQFAIIADYLPQLWGFPVDYFLCLLSIRSKNKCHFWFLKKALGFDSQNLHFPNLYSANS